MDCNLFSGSCYIKMLFTLLTLIIHNNKLLIALFLQMVSNHNEQLPFTFLRHLLQCWYNVIQLNHTKQLPFTSLRHLRQCWYNVIKLNHCEGVKPCYVTAEHKTELYTKFTCRCGHATFFVSCYTKEHRELRR